MGWKDPPADSSMMWINKSIELQPWLLCNWDCPACDQFSQFPQIDWIKRGAMTMEQVAFFASEMKSHHAFAGRLRCVGGEPSLFPKFEELIRFLHRELVETGHLHALEVVTNGSKPDRIDPIRHLVRVRVSGNKDKERHHTANLLVTPRVLGYVGKPCSAPWHCGISLNKFGYFPCSSGAGIARIEDWMKWQRLSLPTCKKPCNAVWETWPDLSELCGSCYHALRPEDKTKCGLDASKNQPGPHIKPQLDQWLNGRKPSWAVYGSAQPQVVAQGSEPALAEEGAV